MKRVDVEMLSRRLVRKEILNGDNDAEKIYQLL